MKIIQTYILLIVASFGYSQSPLLIDKVVARIGGETILLSDIEAQYAFAKEQGADSNDDMKCQILEGIISQKLIVHQARLDSIEVSEDEINADLDFRLQGVLRQMNNDEQFFEEYYGMSVDEMRNNLREDVEQQKLAEKMQAQIVRDINVTPSEVSEFYENIPADSLPYLSSEVEFAELVIKPTESPVEKQKALDLATDILNQINDGADFGELAKKHSDDPGSGFKGGDLGYAPRGTFVPEFEEAAYNLDEGEVSDPVETEFGYHIIKMVDKKGTKIALKHILIKPSISEADIDAAKSQLDSISTLVNNGDMTFAQAVKKFSLEDVQSYHNNGRVRNPATGKTFFKTSELPTEVYFAIEDLDVNQVSEVLEYPLPTGDKYYRIVQLQSKTKPHKANLKQDYAFMQQLTKQTKTSEYFSNWVRRKLKSTYIEVDDVLGSCDNINELIK